MTNKIFNKGVSTEKELVVQEIMSLALVANRVSNRCIFIDYSGHVQQLTVRIDESKENYNNNLYRLEVNVEAAPVKELVKFRDTLQLLLSGEEVVNDTQLHGYSTFELTVYKDGEPYRPDSKKPTDPEWQDTGDMEEANA